MKKNPECLRLPASQKGFTLLEVLVALVILSVGLLGMASLTASVVRTNSFSDDFTTATALAQDKLEELINFSFADADLSDTSSTNNSTAGLLSTSDTDQQDANNPIDENSNAGGKYTRIWNIWDRTATRKDIAVTVYWTDNLGNTRSLSSSTVKANF